MFDKVIVFLAEGKYVAFSIAIVLGVLFNAKNILAFADTYKKRRIEVLKEAIAIDSINENLKSHFEDEIEGEYFRLAHKVKMDKAIRDACIGWYAKLNRELSLSHFIRARPHLEVSDGKLNVKISIFDKVGYWYNLIIGIILLLSGFFFQPMTNAIQSQTILGVLLLLAMSLFLIFFGFFLLSQTYSVTSAKRVQESIKL